MMPLFPHLVAIVLAASLLAGGCKTTELKSQAAVAVTTLGTEVAKRDEAQLKALEQAITQILRLQRAQLRAEWAQKEAETRLKLQFDSIQQLETTLERSGVQLANALKPVLDRIDAEKSQDQEKGGLRQEALALQMAATMTIANQEYGKIEREATQAMSKKRAELNELIQIAFKLPEELLDIDDTSVAQTILKIAIEDSNEFRVIVADSTSKISDYIKRPNEVELFIKGFVGDNLYRKIEPLLQQKLSSVAGQVGKLAEGAIKSLEKKTSSLAKS